MTSPPHSETLLSRLQVPTLPTSAPSLSICPFPAPGEEDCEGLPCCVQQCGRGFPFLPGSRLAGLRVVPRGAGVQGWGVGCRPSRKQPWHLCLQRHLPVSWCLRPPVGHSLPLPSLSGIICLLAVEGSVSCPHPLHPQLHTPRAESGMTQDPPWAPLPAHPWSCPQSPVLKGEGSLQMLLNASPQHPSGGLARFL